MGCPRDNQSSNEVIAIAPAFTENDPMPDARTIIDNAIDEAISETERNAGDEFSMSDLDRVMLTEALFKQITSPPVLDALKELSGES